MTVLAGLPVIVLAAGRRWPLAPTRVLAGEHPRRPGRRLIADASVWPPGSAVLVLGPDGLSAPAVVLGRGRR